MRFTLKRKLYLLLLPAVLTLVALMVLLVLPYSEIRGNVRRIGRGIDEVVPAEEFSRFYSRQLRECAAFIATASPEHERLYEWSRENAVRSIADWTVAEHEHEWEGAEEHLRDVAQLAEAREAYAEISKSCDLAIAYARSGDAGKAMETFENATEGDPGSVVSRSIEELVVKEGQRLANEMNSLYGAVGSATIARITGLRGTVESMIAHQEELVLLEGFARAFNQQVMEMLVFVLTGDDVDAGQMEQSRVKAGQVLQELKRAMARIDDGRSSSPALERIGGRYDSLNAVTGQIMGLVRAGDAGGGLALLEEETGPRSVESVSDAVSKEVERRRESLQVEVDRINSVSRGTTWGVEIAGALLVVAAIMLAVLLSRTIVRPVIALRDAARDFGEGGVVEDVQVGRRDELGDLALTFNEMAAARAAAEEELRDARDLLEARVEERTRELAEVNEELTGQIEEREYTEAALSRSERRYRELAESLPQIVFELDDEGMITYVNQNAYDMFGYTPRDVESGLAAIDVIEEVDKPRVSGAIDKMMDGRSTGAVREYRARRKDGTTFPCLVYSSLIADGDGNPSGIRGILTDITDRVEMEKALARSEERYRFLADNLNDFAFVTDLAMETLYASPSVEQMLGFTPEEQKKRPPQAALTPDSLRAASARLADELEHDAEREPGRTVTVEVDFVRRDGSAVTTEVVVSFVRDETGRPVGMYGLARDITERLRAEEKLKVTQFEVDTTRDLILRVGSGGAILYANDAACAAYGYAREEILGRTLPDLSLNFPASDWDDTFEVLRDMQALQLEMVGVRAGGSRFPVEASINYLVYGGTEYLVIFGRDISERKEAERRMEALNEELVSINRELNDFAYVISHDLKAPLRGIGSLASWLYTDYADVLDENGRRQLELLLDRAKRMESLIESVLQYSRVGRIREQREYVDLNEAVRGAVEMVGPPDGVKVEIEGTLPRVVAERTRMGQVFQNLIGNAVKFMDKPAGRVTVSCSDDGDRWRFSVADNGPGIDPKYHETVFKMFQTISSRDDVESTGVGLTLVKKIVEMEGGRIWVESEPGAGATFFFTLPKSPADESETES